MRELFIRKLIKMVEQSDIASLEVSSWGRRVRILKNQPATNGASSTVVTVPAPVQRVEPRPAPAPEVVEAAPAPTPAKVGHEVKSPMVGTFYRSPAPDAKPFVEVGDKIKADQVVCIVEAMKLLNEILSEVDGVVDAILIENGQPVEYGQTMFHLKTG
jgi:acetyl-CoA carboxylase biotin carboxyl carrier protein